jgi:hypothetical protein
MKMSFLLTIALFVVFPYNFLTAQTGIDKRIIATLGSDETIAHGENCFLLDKDPESISFVTVAGSGSSKQYYCYDKNGIITGPVKQPDESYWIDCKNVDAEDCVPNDDPAQGNLEEHIDWATGCVKFQGNKYGPYGQKAFAVIKGSINPFDPEDVQKMMDNPEEYNNPKVNLHGIDGTKYGPYPSGEYSDAWFIPSSRLVIYSNHEVSLDGKLLIKSEEYISPCDMWISSNGKDYAWAGYEHIIFSEGTKSAAPLVIKHVESGGKSYLKWIALEEGEKLVLCQKPF